MLDGQKHELNVEEYQSVLEAALDAGVELPHDCKLGTCLVGVAKPAGCSGGLGIGFHRWLILHQACAAKLVSGEVDQTGSTLDDSVIEKVRTISHSSSSIVW
jgi:ferredoxin